jgi:hypothetical protein
MPVWIMAEKEARKLSHCITCGSELHPERAEKYDYCTRPDCQAENARGMTIVSVGVNKAADQYVVLDERTKDEMARGKYQDPRRGSFGGYERPRPAPARETGTAERPRGEETPAESWSKSQQDRALAMHITGRKPLSEIARRLNVSERTVAKMLSAAYAQARR